MEYRLIRFNGMTERDKCVAVALAWAFFDAQTERGLTTLNTIVDTLSISLENVIAFLSELDISEETRFSFYDSIRELSRADRDEVKRIVVYAYMYGGKKGTEYAEFYILEIMRMCRLGSFCD